MSASDYLENKALDHELGVAENVYALGGRFLALFTADPTDANITANEVDVVVDDTAYARQAITFGTAVAGESLNTNAQTFAAVVYGSGAAAYDTTHIGIYDAVTAGNLLFHAPLVATVNRIATKSMTFEIGTVKVVRG